MAYNKAYNPDALPAHAEPEQAAQMIGAMQIKPGNQKNQHRPPQQQPSHGGVPPRVPAPSSAPSSHQYPAPHRPPAGPPRSALDRPLPNVPLGQSQQRPGGLLHPSPPPQNYGFGPPPSQPVRNRPPPASRPPATPQPLAVPNDDPQQLFPLFRAANSSHSGALTEQELGSALVNGDYTSFHPKTVKMMIGMFDRNRSNSISFDEFVSLWRYLAAWRELFDKFDEDRSGRISLREFEKALVAFGYRLSQPFVTVLFATFEKKGRVANGPPTAPPPSGMSFDLFVQACISLRRMTDVFKRYDDDRDGYITVSFEEFLTEILQLQD